LKGTVTNSPSATAVTTQAKGAPKFVALTKQLVPVYKSVLFSDRLRCLSGKELLYYETRKFFIADTEIQH
jgi:hypothetical protein